MFHIKSVNNKKNLTEERKIMRNCASEILIPTFINPPQNEACPLTVAITDEVFSNDIENESSNSHKKN